MGKMLVSFAGSAYKHQSIIRRSLSQHREMVLGMRMKHSEAARFPKSPNLPFPSDLNLEPDAIRDFSPKRHNCIS